MVKKKDKKVAKKREIKKRTLSAAEKQSVRKLADQLGGFISLSGYRSNFSLTTIAKERGLLKYFPKKNKIKNKKETFAFFLEKVLCYKPRTLKLIVRDLLPTAIEKRHSQGNPVLEAEAVELSNTLKELGINLEKEIAELHLPKERPRVVPPPMSIQKILDEIGLHPILLPNCKQLFVDGHVNESVRKACEKYEKHVQNLSGLSHLQGSDLMAQAFSEKNPKISLNVLHSSQEKNEQIGYKFIAMGVMHWWRNTLSHNDEEQLSHIEAVGRLLMVSNLIHQLDEGNE
jgi:uncharacterized protein (TIGR02391 family)